MSKFITNRWIHFAFLSSLLFVAVAVISPENSLRNRIQLIVFDYFLTQNPRESTGQVGVIDIDDQSLLELGQWPWPRTKMAEIVDNLDALGARVIAFDGVLAEEDRTSLKHLVDTLPDDVRSSLLEGRGQVELDNDAVLAQSLERYGRFVSGFTHGIENKDPERKTSFRVKQDVKEHFLKSSFRFNTVARFIPVLEKASKGNGSFMANPELDNVIRRTPMIFTNGTRKELFPSLSIEAVRLYHDKFPYPLLKYNEDFKISNFSNLYALDIGDYTVPVDSDGEIWVHFRKGDYRDAYVPAYKVLDKAFHDEIRPAIDGKVIYIASSAEGLKDLRSTPMGLLPGVEIHVNATEQILDGNFLRRPLIVLNAENYFILVVGLFFILLTPLLGVNWLFLVATCSAAAAFSFSYLGFKEYGLLIDPVYPSLSIGVIFVASSMLKYLRSEAERRQIKGAFGLYVSPDFMKELTKDPDKLKLGGEVKDLSVMFTDIRSFTTISESLTPEELIQLMNDFLTPMSNLVMDNRGTIDKYMGDAMMAFWNAPLDDPEHARHARTVALKMNEALVPINEQLKQKAEAEGKDPLVLNAGIGINTGPCSVGNMGSKQRFAYSALGDAVNLASRLEGQTKEYGVNVLVGEDTQKAVPDYAFAELDLLQVKGKTKPVKIFTLLGDETFAGQDAYKKWMTAHQSMLAAYRIADFDCAAQDLNDARKAAKAIAGTTLDAYYDMYAARIAELAKNPPESDWGGVFVAKSK